MKHSEWLRLQSEGESICATLRQQGYLCRKHTRRLSWKLCSLGQDDYILAWLPAPISDWTLMPNDTSPQREKLWQLIEQTLSSIRGEVMKSLAKRTSQAEDYSRPWAIIRLLPDARQYTVARFFNRQDAQDHRRFLSGILGLTYAIALQWLAKVAIFQFQELTQCISSHQLYISRHRR
jgi:hypothetical protein